MDQNTLKNAQRPLKDRYRHDPSAARITLKANGRIGEGVTCSIETGQALVKAGLHPGTGGMPGTVCSRDLLLQALVACAGVTLAAVATSMGLNLRDALLLAEGDLDFRGTLGVDKQAPVGFTAIRLSIDVDADIAKADLDRLIALTERYCVIYQTLSSMPAMSVTALSRHSE